MNKTDLTKVSKADLVAELKRREEPHKPEDKWLGLFSNLDIDWCWVVDQLMEDGEHVLEEYPTVYLELLRDILEDLISKEDIPSFYVTCEFNLAKQKARGFKLIKEKRKTRK